LVAAARRGFLAILVACAVASAPAFAAKKKSTHPKSAPQEHVLTVTATAYNATHKQTDGKPRVGAWGDALDQLPEGTRAIAVSPDLAAHGLRHNRRVRIEGLDGEFVVLDRTAPGHQNTIDIFMGLDVNAARHFGRRKVKIHWTPLHWARDPGAGMPRK